VPRFLDEEDIYIRGLKEHGEKGTLFVYVDRYNL
jgi:hypothetical protein